MRISGKTILVTGATDGIGAVLIEQLRAKGALVIASGRNPDKIAALQGKGFETIQADLSQPEGVEALLAGLGDRAIDVLVNNAGASIEHDFREGPPPFDAIASGIRTNLIAPIELVARLMPVLSQRPEAMVVNVTSGLAIAPRAGGPVYCATKAGLRSYSMAIRAQLKGTKVHVLEALPPVVATAMTAQRGGIKMERNAREANIGLTRVLRWVYSLSPALARTVMIRF
jgi:uncharacterized oxidoreductase